MTVTKRMKSKKVKKKTIKCVWISTSSTRIERRFDFKLHPIFYTDQKNITRFKNG